MVTKEKKNLAVVTAKPLFNERKKKLKMTQSIHTGNICWQL